jgi:hypothetical protein
MNTVSNFFKQTIAVITGDNAALIAAKNERKSNSALNGQIAALIAKQVDDESAVEDAKDALRLAKVPKELIFDNKFYVDRIKRAQEIVDRAEETLEDTTGSIAYFEAIVKDLSSQVEA